MFMIKLNSKLKPYEIISQRFHSPLNGQTCLLKAKCMELHGEAVIFAAQIYEWMKAILRFPGKNCPISQLECIGLPNKGELEIRTS